jgi:hypothetical protein
LGTAYTKFAFVAHLLEDHAVDHIRFHCLTHGLSSLTSQAMENHFRIAHGRSARRLAPGRLSTHFRDGQAVQFTAPTWLLEPSPYPFQLAVDLWEWFQAEESRSLPFKFCHSSQLLLYAFTNYAESNPARADLLWTSYLQDQSELPTLPLPIMENPLDCNLLQPVVVSPRRVPQLRASKANKENIKPAVYEARPSTSRGLGIKRTLLQSDPLFPGTSLSRGSTAAKQLKY